MLISYYVTEIVNTSGDDEKIARSALVLVDVCRVVTPSLLLARPDLLR